MGADNGRRQHVQIRMVSLSLDKDGVAGNDRKDDGR
jgi:hypothetical protein